MLCRINWLGRGATLFLKNGPERYAILYKSLQNVGYCLTLYQRIEMYLAAEIVKNYQDFFLKKCIFLRQLESFYRSCSVHVI